MRCENTSSHEQPTTNWPNGRCTAADPAKSLSLSHHPSPSLSPPPSPRWRATLLTVLRYVGRDEARRSPRRPAGRSAPSRGGRARGRPNSAGSSKPSPARTRDEEREREREARRSFVLSARLIGNSCRNRTLPPWSILYPLVHVHCTYIYIYVRSGVMEHEYRCR